jgi:hypothetical protein
MAGEGTESVFDAAVRQTMVQAASGIMTKAMETADSKGLPSAIADAMSVKNFRREGAGRYSIEIDVDLIKAPMARAYEFGSGIHATRGEQGTYTIAPRNASMLAFEWSPEFIPWGSKKFIGLAGSKFLFRYVDHPGVQQKAFLLPAARSSYASVLAAFNKLMFNTAVLSFELVLE